MINDDVFKKNMDGLSMLFNYKIDPVLYEIYYRALQSLSDEEFVRAVNILVKRNKFMPKPAEILEVARGNREAITEQAWQTLVKAINIVGVYEDVQFEDKYLAGSVELLGGWQKLCNMTEEDFKYAHVTFRKIYGEHARTKPFRGIVSIENEQKGYKHRELAIVKKDGIEHYKDGELVQIPHKKPEIEGEYKAEVSVKELVDKLTKKRGVE